MNDVIKRYATRTRIEGGVIVLVALAYLWEAHNVPEFYNIPGVPGPTTFPYLLGVIFALCGMWFLVSPADLLARRAGAAAIDDEAHDGASAGVGAWLAANWHFFAMWGAILIYLWFMPTVGFPIATFLFLLGFTHLCGETRWHVIVGLALSATLIIFVGFKYGLNVRLPFGVLERLFV